MVVGESNYAKDDMGPTPDAAVVAVNNDWHFTENVVCRFCISRKDINPTFEAITYLLMKSASDKTSCVSPMVWHSFAYMDIIQQAVRGRGWGISTMGRPREEFWAPGWTAVVEVIRRLRPSKLLFVGAGLSNHCAGKYLPPGVKSDISKIRQLGRLWLRAGNLFVDGLSSMPVVVIPNPGSSRGFRRGLWRDALKKFRA